MDAAPPPVPYSELPPLLPPLCRSYENALALHRRNLQLEQPLQFPLLGNLPLPNQPLGPLYRHHQLLDQCARVHFATLGLDSYHGTRNFGPRTSDFSPQPFLLRTGVRSLTPHFLPAPADLRPP